MGEIVLVRHGQANSAGQTEEEYDRLSPLGHRQAAWLGEWMRDHEPAFDVILSGTMRRHVETAAGMGVTPQRHDARLNEIDYFTLADQMLSVKGVPLPQGYDDFISHYPPTLHAWHQGEISGAESFAAFQARVSDVLIEASAPGRRVLCMTSGGVIGMALRVALGLDIDRTAAILLPIYNSSVHRFHVTDRGIHLAGFNALPHMDGTERETSRTRH